MNKERNPLPLRTALWTFWFVALAGGIGMLIFPVATTATRLGTLGLFFLVWVGLLAMTWSRRWLRVVLLTTTVLIVGFLLLPGRAESNVDSLRETYTRSLRRYDGVRYIWGGENAFGIDCSGLVRRGLVDALWQEGLRTVNPHLVRESVRLWWNDCTARSMGLGEAKTTVLFETASLNTLNHDLIRPGDLAVTQSGVHVLAYLGNDEWIEADPGFDRVVIARAPTEENLWFSGPMTIVRWNLLQKGTEAEPDAASFHESSLGR